MVKHYRKLFVGLMISCVFIMVFFNIAMAKKTKIIYAISPREVGSVTPTLINKFEEEYPNVEVEWMKVPGVPGEQHSLYVTSLTAKSETPDVIAIDVIWPGEFAVNGWAEPLDNLFLPEMQNEFLEGPLSAAMYEGSVYGAPLYTNGLHLYYREDLLQKYGLEPPETWEKLVEEAQLILDKENDPNLVGYVTMWAKIEGLFMNFLQFFWGAGGEFFDENMNVSVGKPAGVRALQFMYDMIYEYKVAPESVLTYRPNDARIMFQQGRAVFMVVQDFVWPMLTAPDSVVKDKVNFKRVPYFRGFENTRTTCMGGWSLIVNAYSKHKKEAWDFIEFITSYDSQLKTAITTGCLPTRKEVYNDPNLIKSFPRALDQYTNFLVGDVRPSAATGAKYPELSDIMQTAIHATLIGKKTSGNALKEAVERINSLLQEE
ncbi:putative ABC transporter-binding protein [subsurface metagenome]